MKLKKTQLFYLVIKFTKPIVVPKACTRSKTKREVPVSYFSWADNYTDVINHFH